MSRVVLSIASVLAAVLPLHAATTTVVPHAQTASVTTWVVPTNLDMQPDAAYTLRRKPRTMTMLVAPDTGQFGIYRLKQLHWRHWGKAAARARGRFTDDCGGDCYHQGRATITLSHLRPVERCGAVLPDKRAYSRATISTVRQSGAPARLSTVSGC